MRAFVPDKACSLGSTGLRRGASRLWWDVSAKKCVPDDRAQRVEQDVVDRGGASRNDQQLKELHRDRQGDSRDDRLAKSNTERTEHGAQGDEEQDVRPVDEQPRDVNGWRQGVDEVAERCELELLVIIDRIQREDENSDDRRDESRAQDGASRCGRPASSACAPLADREGERGASDHEEQGRHGVRERAHAAFSLLSPPPAHYGAKHRTANRFRGFLLVDEGQSGVSSDRSLAADQLMRIAFVAWQGSEHTRRWASFFAARGHDVHVVTCGDAPEGCKDDSPSYAVHDVGEPRLGKPGYLLKIPRVRRLIRSLAPDVVHAHHATSYGLLASVAGIHPLVVTCHGSDVLISGQQAVSRAVLRRVFDAADLITAPGQHVADAARTLGTTTQIAVFQYGVDVDRLRLVAAATRRANATTPDRIRLVSARGLDALYRIDDVIRAMAILRERGIECVYDVAGRGTELAELRRLSQEVGMADQVIFHGHVPESEAERLIAESDVYVSVAESDGVSIALFEAMALGAVPVLSDIPANRLWVRDGVNGLLVDISPAAIADGIVRALELDRADVRRQNLDIVRERGDRDTNLASCEALISDLVTNKGFDGVLRL